jgi:hypothetical protein
MYKLWTTDGDRVFVSKEIASLLKSLPAEKLSSHEAVSEVAISTLARSPDYN